MIKLKNLVLQNNDFYKNKEEKSKKEIAVHV